MIAQIRPIRTQFTAQIFTLDVSQYPIKEIEKQSRESIHLFLENYSEDKVFGQTITNI